MLLGYEMLTQAEVRPVASDPMVRLDPASAFLCRIGG